MKLFSIIIDALNYILNSRYDLSIEETDRRKLFVFFVFILAFPLALFGALHIKNRIYADGIINFIMIFIFIILIIILNHQEHGKNIYRLATFFITLLLFYFLQTGLANGYSTLWILLSPPITFFLMGKKEGLFWTCIIGSLTVLVFFNPYSLFTDFSYTEQFISRHLFVYLTVFLVTYNYESVRQKFKYAMENEQLKLLSEKKKLAEAKEDAERANLLLQSEIKVRELAEQELRRQYQLQENIINERTLEIKKNNAELEAGEKRYRLMADNVDDIIWSTDMNLNFSFISPSVTRMSGYTVEEAMTFPYDRWCTPDSFKILIKTLKEEIKIEKSGKQNPGRHITLQMEHIKKDGTVFVVEIKASYLRDENGEAIGFVGITRDISDRIAMEQEKERMKEQLAQSQKMEALGTLVGGLAHEFNNFLGGIIGSFDLISNALKKEHLVKKDYIEKYLQVGMESSKRSAGLISQLLVLSKRHEIRLSPLNIKNSMNHIYELCSNSFPKSIKLDFRTADVPLVIMGDMVQIEQLLLNLCINASHAMTTMRPPGEKHGGTLTVTAEKIDPEHRENMADNDTSADTGSRIRIQVKDTGVGIEDDVKPRIFEPFYSTKNKKESTGLGLAISYYIINKHGGTVEVHSEQGKGSCFSIFLPAHDGADKILMDENNMEIVHGSGTVLIIDDEPAILKIAEAFLVQCGYNVIAAGGADEGIEIFMKQHKVISAVLLDLSMPVKSGIEVLQELQRIDGEVKVIFSSGMLDPDSKFIVLKLGVKEIVNKPYMVSELSVKMKKAITGE